jgi:hypothetical protein
MNKTDIFLSLVLTVALIVALPFNSQAQDKKVKPSLNASVSQTIGVDTEITIVYSRPGVKGRTIWGELVPWGLTPGNKYSDNKPFPWRVGANKNTTIEVSKDVKVDGNALAAGKYSVHMVTSENDAWVVIFNKVNDAWGSYKYDKAQDALRIEVKATEAHHVEWLAFYFSDLAGTSAKANLHWEKLKVAFSLSTAE